MALSILSKDETLHFSESCQSISLSFAVTALLLFFLFYSVSEEDTKHQLSLSSPSTFIIWMLLMNSVVESSITILSSAFFPFFF